MTDKQTPPDWVLIEAAKRCGWDKDVSFLRKLVSGGDEVYAALCDMIQKYEQPPVDRKLLCAREAIGRHYEADGSHDSASHYRSGENDEYGTTKACIRAIELWEEGFGSD